MKPVTVCGGINIEISVPIGSFPIQYAPELYPFNKIHSIVSGVGYNVAKALHTLGTDVSLLSMTGDDQLRNMVIADVQEAGIDTSGIENCLSETGQSVILYDEEGVRQIHCDLKNMQDMKLDSDLFITKSRDADIVCLCNLNYTRHLLEIAKTGNKRIATDVHVLSSLENDYNRDYMEAADILFLSNENLPEPPANFARRLCDRYNPDTVVIGLGSNGALLGMPGTDEFLVLPAILTRPIVNTVGAGDSLYSAFIHHINSGFNSIDALTRAIIFASWKIGVSGATNGFLNGPELDRLYSQFNKKIVDSIRRV